ncbi:MAG: glycosyltransferase family 4 protein [Candidatus Helarchaeota archaeon]
MSVMKITLIVNSLEPTGGVGRVVINLAESWKQLGHQIHIYTMDYKKEFINNYDIEPHEVSCLRSIGRLGRLTVFPILGYFVQVVRFLLFGFFLVKRLAKESPTIINSHYYFCGISGSIVAKITKIPHVLSIHGIRKGKGDSSLLHYWVDYLMIERLKKVVAFFTAVDPSLKASKRFRGLTNLKILFPCLDRQFMELSQRYKLRKYDGKRLRLTYVGRIERAKGLYELLSNFAKGKGFWSKLDIIGEGTYLEKAKKLAKTLHISSQVHFWGVLDGIEKVERMNNSDGLISFSRAEGFPLTILEFFALGKPCIVFPIAPFVGENGNLSELGDRFIQERLGIFLRGETQVLSEILSPPRIAPYFTEAVCKARKEFVKEFSPEQIAQQYLEFFEKIIKQKLQEVKK